MHYLLIEINKIKQHGQNYNIKAIDNFILNNNYLILILVFKILC